MSRVARGCYLMLRWPEGTTERVLAVVTDTGEMLVLLGNGRVLTRDRGIVDVSEVSLEVVRTEIAPRVYGWIVPGSVTFMESPTAIDMAEFLDVADGN